MNAQLKEEARLAESEKQELIRLQVTMGWPMGLPEVFRPGSWNGIICSLGSIHIHFPVCYCTSVLS